MQMKRGKKKELVPVNASEKNNQSTTTILYPEIKRALVEFY